MAKKVELTPRQKAEIAAAKERRRNQPRSPGATGLNSPIGCAICAVVVVLGIAWLVATRPQDDESRQNAKDISTKTRQGSGSDIGLRPSPRRPSSVPSTSPQERKRTGPPRSTKAWYEGGTLARANAHEWKVASYRNRLASAADMVASLRRSRPFSTMTEMRRAAEQMETCITEAAKGAPRTMSVAELGAACAILLGY